MTTATRSEKRRATKVVGVRMTPEQYKELLDTAERLRVSASGVLMLGWTLLQITECYDGQTVRAPETAGRGSSRKVGETQ